MIRGAAMLLVVALTGMAAGWVAREVAERQYEAPTVQDAAPVQQAAPPVGARAGLSAPPPETAKGRLRTRDGRAVYVPPSSPDEFLRRLDEIAGLARSGDTRAAMTLWEFLSRCGGETHRSVADIQEQYERDLQHNAANAENRRTAALGNLELCRSVGWRPLDALGWLEYALATGYNEAAFAAATRAHQALSQQEATRYAERLTAIIAAGTAALEQQLAQGDTRALNALAAAHRNGALAYDPVRHFAYRYAHALTPAAPNEWRPDLEFLSKDLTPEQREEGMRLGREVFEACCADRP